MSLPTPYSRDCRDLCVSWSGYTFSDPFGTPVGLFREVLFLTCVMKNLPSV